MERIIENIISEKTKPSLCIQKQAVNNGWSHWCFFLAISYCFSFYVDECFACMCVQCSWKPEKSVRFTRNWSHSRLWASMWRGEPNLSPLQEQPELLTTEPSPHVPSSFLSLPALPPFPLSLPLSHTHLLRSCCYLGAEEISETTKSHSELK